LFIYLHYFKYMYVLRFTYMYILQFSKKNSVVIIKKLYLRLKRNQSFLLILFSDKDPSVKFSITLSADKISSGISGCF